ncbi:BEL1-like homeodomain protein 9 [Papaver somniferum]|uniref:BEL1-like homeodomain protein 9 n=1 Tax=Papaver somniferum TaxID=3469 RepID=UPI000E6FD0BE|nr:BEL1-like homeodomain protein 9 [Papaver somniferum]
MADGFELFHIPQQSRRDKLRILSQNNNPNSDQNHLTFIGNSNNHVSCSSSSSLVNFTGTYDTTNTTMHPTVSSSYNHHQQPYHGVTIIPSSSNNNNSFLGCSTSSSQPHHHRVFDQYFNGGDMLGHGLSLSLSNSQKTHHHHHHHDQQNLPTSVRPFAGYALVLKGSRFLKPAKQLLEEFCDVGSSSNSRSNFVDQDSCLMESSEDRLDCSDDQDEHHHWRKTRLISILDEVYQRYKQYYQQVQAVVGAFESVTGLENAAPNIGFSLNAMSKHFRLLKNMITGQLRFSNKSLVDGSAAKRNLAPTVGASHKGVPNYTQVQEFGIDEHHVWRPQRGLPQRAVAVLRAWLFEHFLHPYPTDTDKQMLAKQTGLSRSQVSNWFINARVRLWKPMVEEVHSLETLQTHKRPNPSVEGQNS